LAAPVTTKDVLRRFPVLDRLINKLGGRIDNNTMDELRKKTENEDIKEAVREFLKTQNLI
jgi:glycine betaine/choline ABC-type transport system substrate-binding protein